MTEPVKRYFHSPIMGMQQDNRDGDWCRYEPRFDAPQLSREEVDLIEWARLHTESLFTPESSTRSVYVKLAKLRDIITRLRSQPQASPWVPCSERMPGKSSEMLRKFWVTDGESVAIAELTGFENYPWTLTGFTPTHWAPIVRPELPK